MQIMLQLMQAYWAEAFSVDQYGKKVLNEAKAREAGAWAVAVAPYVHPKLASVEPRPEIPPQEVDGMSPLEKARRVAFALIQVWKADAKAKMEANAKRLPAKVKTP